MPQISSAVHIEDFYRLAPIFVACFFGILVMVLDPFVPERSKSALARLAVFGGLAALFCVLLSAEHMGDSYPDLPYTSLIRVDYFSVFMFLGIFTFAVLAMLGSIDYLEREHMQHGEYYALILFATVGMAVMACAQELLTAFVGLEVSSIASYILAGYRRNAPKSNESALKYFLLGSFATAFYLYGSALIFGGAGSTQIEAIRESILHQGQTDAGLAVVDPRLLVLGSALVFVGLSFKVAVAPFQFWAPDVYEGAPTPVSGLFASGPKAAAFAIMVRVFYTAFGAMSASWFWVVWSSALLSMCIGNLAAVVQTNVKRMLAYSSIAHAGYILVAFAANTKLGIAALLFYILVYALVNLGAFTLISHLGDAGERHVEIQDLAGLGRTQPLAAACMSLYLLSLMGLPITAGFMGKLYIFQAALNAQLTGLAVVLAVNSVISAYYYLRVVRIMYFSEPAPDRTTAPVPYAVGAVVLFTTVVTIYLGLFPDAVRDLAQRSAGALR
ncbi:MAG TPA: NADH-quinone oxidoreductase subunit N [Candidatus Acidoferrales bacterium]|nr:NADH-quinone oxidoreductase subunit N [Candidatus Acidoferrales bacterium]